MTNERLKEIEDFLQMLEIGNEAVGNINERPLIEKIVKELFLAYLDLQKENRSLQEKFETGMEQYNDLIEEKEELVNENIQLKDIINKAIDFFEKWGNEADADMYMQIKEYKEYKELMNILKGDDNE